MKRPNRASRPLRAGAPRPSCVFVDEPPAREATEARETTFATAARDNPLRLCAFA